MILALILLSWVFMTQRTLAQANGQSLGLFIAANQLWTISVILSVTGFFLVGFVPLYMRLRDGSLLRVSYKEIIYQRPDPFSLCTKSRTTLIKTENIREVLYSKAWIFGSYQPVLILKTGNSRLRLVVSDARHVVGSRRISVGAHARGLQDWESHPLVRTVRAIHGESTP